MSDPYEILGLPQDCTDENIIRRAWRKKTLKWHPDKHGINKKFIKIQEAYKVIKADLDFKKKIKDRPEKKDTFDDRIKKYKHTKISTVTKREAKKILATKIEDAPISKKEWKGQVRDYKKKRNKDVKIKDIFKFGNNNLNKEVFNSRFEEEQKNYRIVSYKPVKSNYMKTTLAYAHVEQLDDENETTKQNNSDSDDSENTRNTDDSENDSENSEQNENSAFDWAKYMAPNPC